MFSHICRSPSSFSDSILEVIVINVQMKKTVKVQITQELNIVENVEDNVHNTKKKHNKGLVFWALNAETLQTKS